MFVNITGLKFLNNDTERLTGALLDRLTHHVHILEMNGESYRLKRSRENAAAQAPDESDNP